MNQAEDVEVILAHDRHYKFHSGTLARSSTLLASMLTEPLAAKLSKKARNAGVKVRWMIELKEIPTPHYPGGRLDLVELRPTGERADGRTGMILNQNGRVPIKTFDYYEAIFYAFYNKEIRICDTDMINALADCVGMLDIAKYLGCINIISKPVEVALLKHGQSLFRSIQSMPLGWAVMALTIQSETIFSECVIHLAGNWKKLRTEAGTMDRLRDAPAVKHLVEKYHRQLMAKGKALEVRIMSVYPGDMCTPTQEFPIKREKYAKDILVWMALTFFRHWLGQCIINQKGYHSEDGGYELYKQLGTAGEAYMDKLVMNQFHTKFPMTKKAMNVLENHLLEIKECVKEAVDKSGILATTCQLDVRRYPVKYLTCVQFEREGFPWLKEERMHMAVSGERGKRMGGNDIARQNLEAAKRMQERGDSFELSEDEFDSDLDDDGRVSGNGTSRRRSFGGEGGGRSGHFIGY